MKTNLTIFAWILFCFCISTELSAQCPYTVDAGIDQTLCADISGVSLNATTNATSPTIVWTTSGTGSFTPGTNVLNPTYTPSLNDRNLSSVNLTVTISGLCTSVSDFMVVNFHKVPTISAGADKTVCSTVTAVSITGTTTNNSSQQWTSSGTGGFGNSGSLSTTYTPTTAEKSAGYATLTLTTTGTGACSPVSDYMYIYFTTAPTANAGSDQSICANATNASLSGSVGGSATGGTWSTVGGSGTFNSPTSMTPVYTPSQADKNAGSVVMKLTTSNSTVCASTYDVMTLTISPLPTANAGIDGSVCNNTIYQLNGSVGGSATGGTWTTNGSGTFGNASSLSTTYFPSTSDQAIGNVVLTLVTSGSGACSNPAQDQMVLSIATCTGLSSQANNQLDVYPNPGSGIIHIKAKNSNMNIVSAEVFNTESQLVKSFQLTDSQIDISGLNKGIYFLKLNDSDGKQLIQKLVVQ